MNGVFKEQVYVEQPFGFETHDMKANVCELKKALYGLEHAPMTWYVRMDKFLMSLGFTRSKVDSNLYFKVEGGKPVMLLLCDNDLFSMRDDELIKYARRRLATEFEMKYIGMMHYFLCMEVW